MREVEVTTPFGKPSDKIVLGEFKGRGVAFLARHGKGHEIAPGEIPARANIYAMKSLGVTHIISPSAVGSLKEELRPLDVVIPDQIFDRTHARPSTFFEEGIVCHIGFKDPFCEVLSKLLFEVALDLGERTHRGTYVCMEGPQFSTKAESLFYRACDFDIIGMTALPEAKLAREAEICYATIATVTDYDVWHETEEDVTIETVIKNVMKNEKTVQTILEKIIPKIPLDEDCECRHALDNAVVTSRDAIPDEIRSKLDLLLRGRV
ncbi:MAG: S-methyl-5'-thioadenosine phosphorylase [Candidatus Syntrophoarchaeum sp. GoM_oil]|nr:MAG: S-methyl-5'-thioadenosine phosphorylase [Candidatus Syntrophoarchaeum sp. GoM_oil]